MFGLFNKDKDSEGATMAQLPELRDVLGDYKLPTFPKVAMGVLRDLRDPETRLDLIAEQIALDPGLHLRVLRTINAAAFGLSRKVDDLQHALALLGRAKLEALVVAVAVKKTIPQRPIPGFDAETFWAASARRASLARRACSVVAPKESAEALTAGLLQDLAVPVLARLRRKEYVKVYDRWRRDPTSELVEMEHEAFGYDHAQVGALIAREWDLSGEMAELILGHHDPGNSTGLCDAVRLTSRLRDLYKDSRDTGGLVERASDLLGIPVDRAELVIRSSFDDAREFLTAIE